MFWKVLAGAATFFIARQFSGSTLKYETVNGWIVTNSNRDNIGRGYVGGHFSSSGGGGFAELVRENQGGTARVSAAIIFDKRSGPVARKTWDAKSLDGKLEKMFGNSLRVQINV